MDRKKKLRFIQFTLLLLGILIIFFTYIKRENNLNEELIESSTMKKIEKQLSEQETSRNDVFYNIEYSGFDLNGNRYIILSKEAIIEKNSSELVNMKNLSARFYFKNESMLNIQSDKGIYNNRTLDIQFFGNVKGNYQNSQLFAQNASYINSKGFVSVSDDVKIIDPRGTVFAKKLLFDINAKTLKITSDKNKKVKANINLK